MCQGVFADALRAAVIETRMSESASPRMLPYTVEQIFERDLPAAELPEPRTARKKPR
jgi:hypothetical protein